jgi:hypothetical protein
MEACWAAKGAVRYHEGEKGRVLLPWPELAHQEQANLLRKGW